MSEWTDDAANAPDTVLSIKRFEVQRDALILPRQVGANGHHYKGVPLYLWVGRKWALQSAMHVPPRGSDEVSSAGFGTDGYLDQIPNCLEW